MDIEVRVMIHAGIIISATVRAGVHSGFLHDDRYGGY